MNRGSGVERGEHSRDVPKADKQKSDKQKQKPNPPVIKTESERNLIGNVFEWMKAVCTTSDWQHTLKDCQQQLLKCEICGASTINEYCEEGCADMMRQIPDGSMWKVCIKVDSDELNNHTEQTGAFMAWAATYIAFITTFGKAHHIEQFSAGESMDQKWRWMWTIVHTDNNYDGFKNAINEFNIPKYMDIDPCTLCIDDTIPKPFYRNDDTRTVVIHLC